MLLLLRSTNWCKEDGTFERMLIYCTGQEISGSVIEIRRMRWKVVKSLTEQKYN